MTEQYTPTAEDKERARVRPGAFKVSGDQVFATLQGEGMTAGEPAVFLRLQLCNLACGFSSGWKCDTGYTWDRTRPEFWQEPQDWSYPETAMEIESSWESRFGEASEKRMVITGGEPLMQQKKIAELIKLLPEWKIEIETNGTIMPIPELETCQFNCSPKLENSGNTQERRYKPNVLRKINQMAKSQFKFVVVEPSDLLEVKKIVDDCELDEDRVLIMPEGHTAEDVAAHAASIAEGVSVLGWKIAMRNHLVWFGPKRRT